MKLVYVFLIVGLLSCKSEQRYDNESPVEAMEGRIEELDDKAGWARPDAVKNFNEQTAPVHEAKIIKTANLLFETATLETTHSRILYLVKAQEGFIQRNNSGTGYNRVFKQLVIRVPTANFQALVDSIGFGVAYFDQKEITRSDVSEEFVDLQARLKTKRQLETRYLELLTKAKNVTEMLQIERELANIREEIEAKQGRLKYLQDQVSLSTINLEFYTESQETGATVSYGRKMGNALKGGWNGISNFFINLLYLWPLVIFIALVVLLTRRYLKRRRTSPQGGTK